MEFLNECISPSNENVDYYAILGCNELSNTEQIITEYRIKARQFHPDKNSNDSGCTEEFKKLQIAKDVLVNPETRKEYDAWRHSGLNITFKKWMSMKDTLKQSMHWTSLPRSSPMIKPTEAADQSDDEKSFEDFSETLRNFRNYEI